MGWHGLCIPPYENKTNELCAIPFIPFTTFTQLKYQR